MAHLTEHTFSSDDIRPVTGRTVFFWLAGFFSAMLIANAFFVYFALSSFPGVVTEQAYEDGLAYNGRIAASRAQVELNWDVSGKVWRDADGVARISVTARDAAGAPLTGLAVTARLLRPASPEPARTVSLQEGETGSYSGGVDAVAAGRWILDLDAQSGGEGEQFISRNRIFLDQ
ncbi:FixH family protein [Stappia sp.]|uniref:FixH family protein n=1 Tax=Stappia sp. TaxID=1870903 RepID=UPI003D0985B4